MKAAIYCRLSEEDKNKSRKDDDSLSIQNQKTMLIKYAMDNGWDVYDIYSDDDYAGADRNRPEFQRILADAEARKFDVILCKTQSRFTRELELVEKYIHGLFLKWGIRFIGLVDNADTSIRGNKKSRQINGLVNEWYLEDMSENIRSTLTSRREDGFHIGSFALYGYMKDPNRKGHLLIDEEAAQVVREVFSLYTQGYGKTNIARMLNDRGIPNPTEYKRRKNLRYKPAPNRQSTLWKYYTIRAMLTNEMYIGNMVQGKYGSVSYKTKENRPKPRSEWIIVENTHEPIVDMQTWSRAQTLVEQRAKPFNNGKVGLFSKKVRCINCGYTLRTSKTRNKYYLKCGTHYVSPCDCEGAFISVEKLTDIVLGELRVLIRNHLDKAEWGKNIVVNNGIDDRIARLEANQKQLGAKVSQTSNAIRQLYMDKVSGVLCEKDFIALSADLCEERDRLEESIVGLQKELNQCERRKGSSADKEKIMNQYMDIDALSREHVVDLIDYILVGKRDKNTKKLPVEIHWNF